MVLRNVPSTATFEEQRVEINELAVDVDTLASNPDTLQTVTDRGFTTDNPIKIENYAATAFVVEDGSSNEKFVVDSVNGKINVGSSAGGASGIYLFHNNSGATPAITLDGATGSITNKGQLVTESILSSAALNNKGSIQFGTVDAYSIGHMPLNSNLAFSQTHGGSYLFYSDASTVELEIASGGVKVDGILESSLLVNTNNTPTAGEGIEMFYDSAASGGAAGAIQSFNRDSNALTRLKIRSSNWEIDNDGSGSFAGGGAVINSYGQLVITRSDSNAYPSLTINSAGTTTNTIDLNGDGSASFGGEINVGGYDGSSTTTDGVLLGSVGGVYSQLADGNPTGVLFQGMHGSTFTSRITAAGSAMFANDITLDRATAPSDVKISGSDTHAVWLSDGKFVLKYDGSAQFGESGGNFVSVDTDGKLLARNSSSSATVVLAANFNGTDNFTVAANGTITSNSGLSATSVNLQSGSTNSWFQTGTSISSTNYVWAAKDSSNNVWHSGLQTDGDLYLGGNLAGSNNIELSGSDGTGWFQNPSGDTTLSLGDLTNSNGRLVLTAKTSSLEIHSRSNHQINFLFNTVTKATLGIGGDLSLAGGITLTGQTSTAASGSGTSSDAFDHYEEGSWTPTPLGLSNSPTFSNLKGRFVRIGSLVQINGFIQMASSPTWNNVNDFFMLGPLPFNYNADNAGYFATAGSVTCQNFNFHDNDYNNTGQVNCGIANSSGVSYVCFLVSDNNNTRGTVKNSAISGNDIIEFSLTYRAG